MFETQVIYKNYSAKGNSESDIIKRMVQRQNWVNKNLNDPKKIKCRDLLISARILPKDEDSIDEK